MITFNNTFTPAAAANQPYVNCIIEAENFISSHWSNDVTLNLNFDYAPVAAGLLASNYWPSTAVVSYDTLANVLRTRDASFMDANSLSQIFPASDPTVANSNTPSDYIKYRVLDANPHNYTLPEAYARMLGLSSATPVTDDTITLSSTANWSYGQDVVDEILHEITEGGMGRVGGLGDQNSAWSTMDLFRHVDSYTDVADGRDAGTEFGGPAFFYAGDDTPFGGYSLTFNDEYQGNTQVNTMDVADFTQLDVFGTGQAGDNSIAFTPLDYYIMEALGWTPGGATNPKLTSDFTGGGTSGVLLQSGAGLIDWSLSNGAYSGYVSIGSISGYLVIGTGDFNGDGTTDLLLQNAGGSLIDWIMGNGAYAGYNSIGNPNASGYGVVGIGDFNGDRTSDILLENGSGALIDWIIKNGTYSSYKPIGNTSGYGVIGTGDFNGDGTTDILLQNGSGSIIDWIMNNGTYSYYNPIGNANASGYGMVGTGYFNGDGTSDILLENGSGNLIDWIIQNGTYSSYNEIANTSGYAVVGTGDYDGDGTSDILLQNAAGNVIDWIVKNGQFSGWHEVGSAGSYAVVHK